MANKDDPSSTNKSQLRVMDDGQIQSVAKSLRESTNGTIVGSCNIKAVDSIFFVFWLTALFILTDYMPFTSELQCSSFYHHVQLNFIDFQLPNTLIKYSLLLEELELLKCSLYVTK